MAFGTGEHATTATCLRLLADLAPELPEKFYAMDLGTGSGILAIAAEALGAGNVYASDYDATAVRVAKQNARKNRCKTLTVEEADVFTLKANKVAHVVMANLFSDVLIGASPRIAKATKPGGYLIFSGVLRKQAEEVSRSLGQSRLHQTPGHRAREMVRRYCSSRKVGVTARFACRN